MAKIVFDDLSFSYSPNPAKETDWVLRGIGQEWSDGGAYALLGPSGCGKTTLLNLISGLLRPTRGRILFDREDVSRKDAKERNIAQVFQFPVVYDTMSVFDNVAFPLRNRKISKREIKAKVDELAGTIGLQKVLHRKARGLSADLKQMVSMARGLIREDVSAVLFDEPLTVIDPKIKWEMRFNLKRLHKRFNRTLIYVTHDQTEAMTFADEVIVMHEGEMVQKGKPQELVEKPKHTFVGHFIGSPGINLYPCQGAGRRIRLGDLEIPVEVDTKEGEDLKLGVRPEHVELAGTGYPAKIRSVKDLGVSRLVEAAFAGGTVKVFVEPDVPVPAETGFVRFPADKTYVYRNEHLVES